jgi:predicted small lipoprotein YifL
VPAVTPRLLLLACVLVLAAAGCGQKGPLYMPDEPQDEATEETDE